MSDISDFSRRYEEAEILIRVKGAGANVSMLSELEGDI